MTRRILFILLAALALALLVGVLWFWFFSGGSVAAPQSGTFGSGADKTTGTTGGSGSQNNNIPSGVVGSTNGGTNTAVNGSSLSGAGGIGSAFAQSNVQGVSGVESVDGVDWLGGSVGGVGGPTTSFVPKTVNQLNSGGVSGSVSLLPTGGVNSGSSGNNSGLGLAIGGVLGAGVGCAALGLWQTAAEGLGYADATKGATPAFAGGFVLTYDFSAYQKNSAGQLNKGFKDVGDCLARTIGKAVIQQMTNSIVNWINSGFNGKPSFVKNFQQYFTNVGDAAAGEFIRGTGLSFLCSPFQLKIRIAIAQSYARRNNAGTCTLTGIVKNYNNFVNGSFNQGGWGGLLQLTTVPTNNPYGAYAYAQIGLATAQNSALNNANRNITPGGFISLQKEKPGSCKYNDSDGQKYGCQYEVATPGALIEDSLKETLKQPFLANQLANSFDQIVSALLNQLITKTLYNGLSSLSGTNGLAADYLTPEQQQAQNTAQAMLQDMQGRQQVAQQYGSVAQGAIGDIQNAQQQLEQLANCYSSHDKQALASSTEEVLHAFDPQIDAYNSNITRANQAIATLQDLQTRALNVATPADVAAVQASYQQAISSGVLITAAQVTNAQQDRTTLQSNLANRNQLTTSALNQCNAL